MKYAVVGGDARSARLCELLTRGGDRVYCYALEKAEIPGETGKAGCLQGCVYGADCVVLPVPTESGGVLNTPLSDNTLTMREVLGALWPGQTVIGGRFGEECCVLAQKAGLHIEDVLLRPELAFANAAITAECALAKLIEASDRSLYKSRVLICGMGRIARQLAMRLRVMGADVTIAARSRRDRAEAGAYLLHALDYAALEGELGSFQYVVNTVPARVLTDAMLCMLSEDAVIMELASPPGGFDRTLAENIGLKTVYAPGLPGKMAAYSAAEELCRAVHDIMRKQEECI